VGASTALIHQTYDRLSTRYQNLLARGADDPVSGFPQELDLVRNRLNSVAFVLQNWKGDVNRLNDIVVSEGLKIKPVLDKIESKYPPGSMVRPGSSVNQPGRLAETLVPTVPMNKLEASAPVGIGAARGGELLDTGVPWYFVSGIDLRIVGAVVGGVGILVLLWRKMR
jgi:hypothetical protein